MASNKIQFRSIHELKDPALNGKLALKEFQEEIPVEDFLESAEKTDGTNPLDGCSYNAASVTLARSAAWNNADCDGDGVTNGTEITNGTDPKDGCSYNAASVTLARSAAWNATDCDGDGVINGTEITDGTDPQNGCDLQVIHMAALDYGISVVAAE